MSELSPIVIATANEHKVREMSAILTPLGVRLISLSELPGPFTEPDEIGDSFLLNATIKARSYAQQTGKNCLADDSGLCVDALDGSPGVISSHYCTQGQEVGMTRDQRDIQNNKKLMADLLDVPLENRTARFVCTMVLAAPNGLILSQSQGSFLGRIGTPSQVPKGNQGFGYDPLFFVAPDYTRTSAELTPAEKNAISHRAQAAQNMAQLIQELQAAH